MSRSSYVDHANAVGRQDAPRQILRSVSINGCVEEREPAQGVVDSHVRKHINGDGRKPSAWLTPVEQPDSEM